MKISDILRYKGSDVVTIGPDVPVRDLVQALAQHNLGALIVVDGAEVVGVVSERDIVRKLNSAQSHILDGKVRAIMSSEVISCRTSDSIEDIAAVMTDRRIRHMPVIDEGTLVGIVTIGDVVLSRSRELEQQRRDLEQYIAG